MIIKKLEHACIVLEENDHRLIVDPGELTQLSDTEVRGVDVIVVTHQHGDHWSMKNLERIASNNPQVKLFAPFDMLEQISKLEIEKIQVAAGVSQEVGSWSLQFYGGQHAKVTTFVPCANVGVFINKRLYYPGDSFDGPDSSVSFLAVPACAPWMKVSEATEFIARVQPEHVFPTHDGLLSDFGRQVTFAWLQKAAEHVGAGWHELAPGDTSQL